MEPYNANNMTNGNGTGEKAGKHCPIEGICCKVENCYYHDQQTHCTAREVSVGPGCAHCSEDTVCATFKPREEN